jgi:hypothetical protein
VARGDGVIRDPEIHRQVLLDVLTYAVQDDYMARGLLRSPLLGPKGNAEFLAWLSPGFPPRTAGLAPPEPAGLAPPDTAGLAPQGEAPPIADLEALIESVFPPAPEP